MRKINEFQVDCMGIDSPSYFPGVGVSKTEWEHVAVGIGDNAYDALNDALAGLSQAGWDTADLFKIELELALNDSESVAGLREEELEEGDRDEDDLDDDRQYYVAVFVK